VIDVAAADLAEAIRGALDIERTGTGLIPVRIPERLVYQVPDLLTLEVFRLAGGVRLAFETEATVLELDVAAYRALVAEADGPEYPFIFDLMIDGKRYASHTLSDWGKRTFDLDANFLGEERRSTTLRFDGLPSWRKAIELWLPHTATVEICALRADAPVHVLRDPRPRWLHYGSSISHCYEAHSPTQTWPAVAAQRVDVDLLNLGVAGSCFLDQFAARAIRDEPAACISLKLGINVVNADALKIRTFAPTVHGFLDTVREGHPDTPILVVSPIICPPHEHTPGPTIPRDEDGPFVASAQAVDAEAQRHGLTLLRVRAILEEVVRARSEDDANLHYLSGLTLFNEHDLADLPDFLHPNGDGYLRIGERFAAAAFGPDGSFSSVV
jgi:hypothetical protein